jgi:hypothetical protein
LLTGPPKWRLHLSPEVSVVVPKSEVAVPIEPLLLATRKLLARDHLDHLGLEGAVQTLAEYVVVDMRLRLMATMPEVRTDSVRVPATWWDHWLQAHRGRWYARLFRRPRFIEHTLRVESRALFPDIEPPPNRMGRVVICQESHRLRREVR